MHKKLEADLISLAHSVLQMKNKKDVFALKEKSQEIYEKLSLLAFVEEFVNVAPNLDATKEGLIAKVVSALELKEDFKKKEIIPLALVEDDEDESKMEEMANEVADSIMQGIENEEDENFIEQPFAELEKLFSIDNNVKEVTEDTTQEDDGEIEEKGSNVVETKEKETFNEQSIKELEALFGIDKNVKDDVRDVAGISKISLEDELKDTISVDVAADMFEKVIPKKSLNDQLQKDIQIGLNDRIAFVKNLFDGSQEDFNRVVSQLNTYGTEKEALKFINKMVKPDYDWSTQEELETRFIEIVERRFT